MKKLGYFLSLFFYIVGTIGGFGYAALYGEWFIAACLIVVGAMAFPTAKRFLNELVD